MTGRECSVIERLFDKNGSEYAAMYSEADPVKYRSWMMEYFAARDKIEDSDNKGFEAWLQRKPECGIIDPDFIARVENRGLDLLKSEEWEVVYIRPSDSVGENISNAIRTMYKELSDVVPPNYYGRVPSNGDIYICGKNIDDIAAYFIGNQMIRRAPDFADNDNKMRLRLAERIDISREYNLLSDNKWIKDAASDQRRDQIANNYVKAAVQRYEATKAREKSHHETDKKRRSGSGEYADDGYKGRFSNEEVDIAKSTDIVSFLSSRGYPLKRLGSGGTFAFNYPDGKWDSFRIFSRTNSYCRYSDTRNCGTALNFLENMEGMSFREAMRELLDFNAYSRKNPVERKNVDFGGTDVVKTNYFGEDKNLVLPPKNEGYRNMYAYLTKTRGIAPWVVNYFMKQGCLYEDDHHNVVFVGKDKDGVPRYGFRRGTMTYAEKPFKRDCQGSDKHYGFSLTSDTRWGVVYVFEGAIDLMSYMTIMGEDCLKKGSFADLLALGGCSNYEALETYIEEHYDINGAILVFDTDQAGLEARKVFEERFNGKVLPGRSEPFIVNAHNMDNLMVGERDGVKYSYKDMNDALMAKVAGTHPYYQEIENVVRVNKK